jgi:predicted nucleic acid-binding protein
VTAVVVDTSVWVSFLRWGADTASDELGRLIRDHRAVLVGPVLAELLQGLRSREQEELLGRLFPVLPFLGIDRSDWEQAGASLRELRGRGITVPLIDAVIAAVAHRHGLPVLTLDPHFGHLPVERVEPSADSWVHEGR